MKNSGCHTICFPQIMGQLDLYREKVIEIKNRERQRANRRLKNKEELLDRKNSLGVKDLTAYNAVKQMATNGKASIAWK